MLQRVRGWAQGRLSQLDEEEEGEDGKGYEEDDSLASFFVDDADQVRLRSFLISISLNHRCPQSRCLKQADPTDLAIVQVDEYDDGPVRCVCGVKEYIGQRDAALMFVRCSNEASRDCV